MDHSLDIFPKGGVGEGGVISKVKKIPKIIHFGVWGVVPKCQKNLVLKYLWWRINLLSGWKTWMREILGLRSFWWTFFFFKSFWRIWIVSRKRLSKKISQSSYVEICVRLSSTRSLKYMVSWKNSLSAFYATPAMTISVQGGNEKGSGWQGRQLGEFLIQENLKWMKMEKIPFLKYFI